MNPNVLFLAILFGFWAFILLYSALQCIPAFRVNTHKTWGSLEKLLGVIRRLWGSLPKLPLKVCAALFTLSFVVITVALSDYSPLKPWFMPVTYSIGIAVGTWLMLRFYEYDSSDGLSLDGWEKEYFLSGHKRTRRKMTFVIGAASLILMYYVDDYSWRRTVALGMSLVLFGIIKMVFEWL